MNTPIKRHVPNANGPMRVLGLGLGARRGVRLTMRAIREATGKTQVDVAGASRMDQADVSRLERRERFDDCQVATLQRYVAALGGTLELVAAFGDKRIVLCGVPSREHDRAPAVYRMRPASPARAARRRR